jgi:serine protease Do
MGAHTLIALAVLNVACPRGTVRASEARDDQPNKSVVQRARFCVLKIECIDRSGESLPTVLSGVALDADGYVATIGLRATNNRTICVKDCGGKKHEAQWVATDESTGVTLLKCEPGIAQPPSMSASLPEVGSVVFVVGNPFGLSHSVSVGIVSGLDRTVSFSGGVGRGLIQFTAPVFPGDGGGLLADRDGRMVGIVSTALHEPNADDSEDRRIGGIGFALPAPELRRIAQRLRDGQRVDRGYLGLTAEDVDGGGIRVIRVFTGSPARKAGLAEGDLIEAMDDKPVQDFDDLARRVEVLRPGTEVTLHGNRSGERFEIHATLGERQPAQSRAPLPAWPERRILNPRGRLDVELFRKIGPRLDVDAARLGLHTQALTEPLAKKLGLSNGEGVVVSGVLQGSPAERAGIRVSDVIVSVNDAPVRSRAELLEAIRSLESAVPLQLEIVRDGNAQQIVLQPAQEEAVRTPLSEAIQIPGLGSRFSNSERDRIDHLEERVKALEALVRQLQQRSHTTVPDPSN